MLTYKSKVKKGNTLLAVIIFIALGINIVLFMLNIVAKKTETLNFVKKVVEKEEPYLKEKEYDFSVLSKIINSNIENFQEETVEDFLRNWKDNISYGTSTLSFDKNENLLIFQYKDMKGKSRREFYKPYIELDNVKFKRFYRE